MAGPSRYFTPYVATMASAGTLTSEVDLGGSYSNAFLEIPTMTSNSVHFIKAAYAKSADGGVYRRVYQAPLNSSTVGTNVFAVVSTATNCIVPIPQGLRYVKIESEVTINDGAVYRIFVGD